MKAKIESIKIVHTVDAGGDTSWIGELTDSADKWNIVREGEYAGEYIADLPEDADLPDRGREYRFFRPFAGGETPGTEDYKKYGKQNFDRMEGLIRGDWQLIGISAVAKVLIQVQLAPAVYRVEEFSSGGLWGIESDSGDYLEEVAREQVAELRSYLKTLAVPLRGFDRMAEAALESDPEYTW